jgi:phosphohistidine phosphatase
MKTLYLLRHAKAEPGSKVISDQERTLSARGREACIQMGAYMKAKHYAPALALASPSARTRETLERVADATGATFAHRFDNTLYLATAEEIVRALGGVDGDVASVMVVGHNPGMHHAALLLSEPEHTKLRTALELKYPTCALAVLQFDAGRWEGVAAGEGALIDFVTPEEL